MIKIIDFFIRNNPKSAKKAVAASIGNELLDLNLEIDPNLEIEPVLENSVEALKILRHSTAHVMAEAVKELFPEVKIAIGPSIENGFYYDFDYKRSFTLEDLNIIEEKMKEIIKHNYSFSRISKSKIYTKEYFSEQKELYKVEILNTLNEESVTLYKQGSFTDLCKGPHLSSTGKIKYFKLLSVAGAYWRGEEKNKMLSRIYGTAFFDKKELKRYLQNLKKAKEHDHRTLGNKLELFSINKEIGAGMILWHPRGAMLRHIIENFEYKEHLKQNYQLVNSPHILKKEVWERSGHLNHYKQNMYFTKKENNSYGIKPMNCIPHMFIYKNKLRSYKELPIRFFELGLVHRYEKSGVLHGLTRVRAFTQDDAHILCRQNQVKTEIRNIIKLISKVMNIFNFEYSLVLSTQPKKYLGSNQDWEKATHDLTSVLKENKTHTYKVNEGDGAFYGPKIDVELKDALGRNWQCSTIQYDLILPKRLNLTYISSSGKAKHPVMIHRTILGSIERFIGILTEHYGGAFPTWLAPEQIRILTITDKNIAWANEVDSYLSSYKIRSNVDPRNESLNLKIREAQIMKIPYMIIIGDKESSNNKITVRALNGNKMNFIKKEEFLKKILEEIEINT